MSILEKYCSRIDLKRLDELSNGTELSLNVEFIDFESVVNAKNELKGLGDIEFSFIENY